MKLERSISIIYKLLNHEVLSASTLAEAFQVSQRTIYRDIDAICAAGFPVVAYQGNKGGYGIMDGFKMDKSLLRSYDVESLIAVLRSLSTVFEDEQAQGTIERLQTVGPEHRSQRLTVDFETRKTDTDTLPRLRLGVTQCKVVQFDYINARNERTTRQLEPLRLHFKYGSWYVYGFCRTRRDYREFRVSRILNLSLTQETFVREEPTEEAVPSNKRRQDQATPVVFRVGPHALAEAIDQFHHADKAFHPDGSMTMRIPVYRPLEARWLWSMLLSLGNGVEVLEPLELREIVKDQLQTALKLYEEV